MNRRQFMDSLRRELEQLPASEQEQILSAYSTYLDTQTARGVPEQKVLSQLGTPAACAADAKAGKLPAGAEPVRARSGNPFEPQMVSQPRRTTVQRTQKPKYQEDPNQKKPWGLIIALTLAAVICLVFVAIRYLSSNTQLGYVENRMSYGIDEVSRIVVEDANRDIRVEALTTSEVQVRYYEGHHTTYDLTLEDGTLQVSSRNDAKWYDVFLSMYDTTDATLVLYIPPTYAGELLITTSNGNISVSDLAAAQELTATSTNGDVSIQNCTTVGALTAASANSPVMLTNVQASGAIMMRSSNGSLTLQQASCQALTMVTTNGLIECYELDSAQTLAFETSNASIMGSVYGSEEEFTIQAETTNSRSNLTNRTGGSRSLRATTTNGTIDIAFLP